MIIDTMVMAYAFVEVPEFSRESLIALHTVDKCIAPVSVESELLNVLWLYGKTSIISPVMTRRAFIKASKMWDSLIPLTELWEDALALAFERDHSPYDTLFVAAARLRRTRLLTYDKKVLKLFPEYAVSVREFLA